MFVTKELLKKLKACTSQRRKFALLFPFGVELSRTVIVQHAQEFDWTWCARNLASADGYAAYLQAERSAWDAYYRNLVTAWDVYQQPCTQAYAAHRRVWAAYKLACATAFADIMGL